MSGVSDYNLGIDVDFDDLPPESNTSPKIPKQQEPPRALKEAEKNRNAKILGQIEAQKAQDKAAQARQKERDKLLNQRKQLPDVVRPTNAVSYIHHAGQPIPVFPARNYTLREKLEYELVRIRLNFVRWNQQFG